ncbi:10020_t:CDS:2 [Gigaspora rosea]|nr:10020_t:CDS:2 [Gigaspora rosea]
MSKAQWLLHEYLFWQVKEPCNINKLFRNTMEYWYKDECPVLKIPKDKAKIKA